MSKPLKILHLEDLPADAELVAREIKKSGITGEIVVAANKAAFIKALKEFLPDVILSDHSLPSFDSHEALKIVKEMDLRVPFILVTATVSEEYAVNIMKEGAIDYILKDRLQRLPNAIWSAIEKMETEVELARQIIRQQKLITETGIQAQEQEREEIGRELHDNINQLLAASKLYLEHAIKKEELQSQLLNKCHENIVNAIEQIRQLSHSLVAPSLVHITLIAAIKEIIANIRLTKSQEVELKIKNFNEEIIDKNIKLMFYRIVQEQTNNIIKHARAKNAIIELEATPDNFILIIGDNGVGFNTNQNFEGIGLRNIKNRVSLYDGTVDIISSPGNGCTLEVRVPVRQQKIYR